MLQTDKAGHAHQMRPCEGELHLKTEKVSIVVSEGERERFLKAAQSQDLDESSAVSVAIKSSRRDIEGLVEEPNFL